MNIKLTISYDGTAYLGWQTSNAGTSIEETLQKILEKILQQNICLQAASRTDAGVHAEGQVVNCILQNPPPLPKLHKSLNQLLPKDIRVTAIEKVKDTFHPSLDAIGKEYHYHVSQEYVPLPFKRHFCWHYPFPLDVKKMRTASKLFLGTHDFQTFSNSTDPQPKDTMRTLYRLDIISEKSMLRFEIHGNQFLYKMVRNLVGTLIYIGVNKLTLKQAEQLIIAKDRTLAGITAPACGLFLKKVFYT